MSLAPAKKCPFCGNYAKIIQSGDLWEIHCVTENCVGGKQVSFPSIQLALKSWNRRGSTKSAHFQKNAPYDNDCWGTPLDFFKTWDDKYHFTLDVCANASNFKVAKYFTKEQDGLVQDWSGEICWCNPPFSEVNLWLQKAYNESFKGAFTACLVKADVSTKWWHTWAEKADEKIFIDGRIKFDPPPGFIGKVGSPNMGNAILIYSPKEADILNK